MKKIIIILSLLLTAGVINSASAQVSVNININVNSQPDWGPIGYDYVEFYYFPDINIYYDIMNSMFFYKARNTWVSSRYLPNTYRRYDLYGMYKVVINNQPQPWMYNKTHKKSYSMYKKDRTQTAIRYSNDSRYNTSRSNNVRWTQPIAQPQTNNGNTTNNRRQSTTTQTNQGRTNSSTTTNNNNNNNNKQQTNTRSNQTNTNSRNATTKQQSTQATNTNSRSTSSTRNR